MSPGSRPVVFVVVGIAGYAVQTAVLWLLVGKVGLPVVPATLVATEAAVLHNFARHLRWTWADRPAGPGAMVMRLLRFNLANGGVSLAGGAALMALLVDAFGVHYLVANLVTVVACGVVNYFASDRWVFTGPDGVAKLRLKPPRTRLWPPSDLRYERAATRWSR